ncbi:PTS beta-glucoside transporter subunit IIBCA [Companilactobacillus zhachilii]|uniref:PTS system sucrose-specific EIIBCA component n=1 Tax=Companilactobacillus zhachilii TaxID=2304606 RepID=A0A386PWI1_9LACO|nr:sucrose-specific PTS transporter subunit IIBC [Companilactobacillus zhachilii]AYE38867.1 PTS beta-glucoside transporter subunit IIBCA [Companilactobacillus zhachilii]
MTKDYSKLAQQIVDLVGVDNIQSVTHCQTRLRFVVKNRKTIDDKAIENLDLVKGVFFGSGQYQVIIGTGVVNDVYDAIDKLGTVNAIYGKDDTNGADTNDDNENKTKLQRFMAMLSGIFIPIIPVIAATGLFLGLQSAFTNAQVLKLFGAVPSDIPTNVNTIISVLTGTVFSFLPALIVWSTFRYFKGTPIIGIVIGLMLVSPNLPNAYSVAGGTAKAIMLFGHIPVVGSQGSVLTALVAGFIGAKMEIYFHKHVPNVLDQIITPFLTMLLTFGIMILGVGPIVHWVENLMVSGVEGVINLPFGIGGFLIGAAYPLMVLIGIHQMMIAIETSLLAATHLNPLIVLEAMYGFANLGVALAMIMRTKSKKSKATFVGALSSQLFGVSEPTLFGILIRYNFKPLIVTVLTSGFGAAILSIFKVAANSYGLAVVPSYLMYIYNARDLIIYTIVSLLTVVVAFVATNMFAIPKDILVEDPDTNVKSDVQDNTVYAPISGKTIALDKVTDPVFASGMMGEGIAITPDESSDKVNIYAPQTGKLTVVADTGHAYGLTTDSGIEILVHIGIDTVSLKGKGFTTNVKLNQTVKKGTLLGSFDPKTIHENKLDDTVMVIITNSKDYLRVESQPDEQVTNNSNIIALQKKQKQTDAVEPALQN